MKLSLHLSGPLTGVNEFVEKVEEMLESRPSLQVGVEVEIPEQETQLADGGLPLRLNIEPGRFTLGEPRQSVPDKREPPEDLQTLALEDQAISIRAYKGLTRIGVRTVADLITKTESEVRGAIIDPQDCREVTKLLESYGLELRQPSDLDEILIEELELSIRLHNVLKRAGIQTIGDLVALSWQYVESRPKFGKKSREELAKALHARGLDLRNDTLDLPSDT